MCANNVICNQLNPNRPLDCSVLMKPSFSHLFRYFSVTMAPIAPSKQQNICAKIRLLSS